MEARPGSESGAQTVGGGTVHGADHHSRAREWDRIAGVAGLVFIALFIASFFTPETPSATDPVDQIAAALIDDRTGHQWSLFFGFIADIAVFVLLAGLWSRLRRWEGPAGLPTALFGLAAAAFMSAILVSEGLYLALVQFAGEIDAASLAVLAALDNTVGAVVLPAGAAMFLGLAAAIVSTRAFPAWLGWLAAVTAVLLVVSLTGVFEGAGDEDEGFVGIVGFAGFILLLVWFLAASILLLMRAGREPEMAA
jgi:hypothetical protein